MGFFTKPLQQEVQTIPRDNPNALVSAIEAYRDAEEAWDVAKRNILRYNAANPRLDSIRVIGDGAIARVNEMASEPLESRRLHRIEREAKAARDEALSAWLRAEGKLVV